MTTARRRTLGAVLLLASIPTLLLGGFLDDILRALTGWGPADLEMLTMLTCVPLAAGLLTLAWGARPVVFALMALGAFPVAVLGLAIHGVVAVSLDVGEPFGMILAVFVAPGMLMAAIVGGIHALFRRNGAVTGARPPDPVS